MNADRRDVFTRCGLVVLALCATAAGASEPTARKVNGTLTEIEGIPVLRVWGTPEERGFANGYLMGEKFAKFFNDFIASGNLMEVKTYTEKVMPTVGLMPVPPAYETELRAMLSGIEAQAGGAVEIPALGRPLRYEDLVATNSMGDLLRMGCSSFAAWGPMTADGHTLAGRNLDWPTCQALEGTQMVTVHVPAANSGELGWVSVFWPGLIGCTTGMNAEGVTVAMHDSNSPNPTTAGGFTSSLLLYREAIESAHARTAVADITRVLNERYTVAGYNMMVTKPFSGEGPAAVVFEHDADLTKTRGMTLREPNRPDAFLICTNHSRKRYEPSPGVRYPRLSTGLERIAGSGEKHHLTVKRAWNMLGSVPLSGIITHHSVVFEPDKRLMHVAFAENGKHAPQCKKVTLDVAKLLAGDYPGGK